MIEYLYGQIFGAHRRRDGPNDDLSGAHVGDERGVAEPLPGPHERDVGDPQPVGLIALNCRFTRSAGRGRLRR